MTPEQFQKADDLLRRLENVVVLAEELIRSLAQREVRIYTEEKAAEKLGIPRSTPASERLRFGSGWPCSQIGRTYGYIDAKSRA